MPPSLNSTRVTPFYKLRANIGTAKARAAIRLAESLGLIAIDHMPTGKRVIVNRCVKSRC